MEEASLPTHSVSQSDSAFEAACQPSHAEPAEAASPVPQLGSELDSASQSDSGFKAACQPSHAEPAEAASPR